MKNGASQIRGVYAIVDDSYPDPVAIAVKALSGGSRIIQLRAKQSSTGDFLALAREIGSACKKAKALFIVNDHADIALACGADGVHLGQDDLPASKAKQVLGKGKLVGLSTHTPDEAAAAEEAGVDYIGFGPLFGTTTKEDALSPRGLEALADVKKRVSIPLVAIGGINRKNAAKVQMAGADAVAVISGIADASDVEAATAGLVQILGNNR